MCQTAVTSCHLQAGGLELPEAAVRSQQWEPLPEQVRVLCLFEFSRITLSKLPFLGSSFREINHEEKDSFSQEDREKGHMQRS